MPRTKKQIEEVIVMEQQPEPKKKVKRILTEEQKDVLRERLKIMRQKKKDNKIYT